MDFDRDVEFGVADRGNIATIVVLKPSRIVAMADDPARLVVGNTHLLYNPKRGEIKLQQLQRLLGTMHEMLKDLQGRTSAARRANLLSLEGSGDLEVEEQLRPSALICGDFNSTPDSAVYEWMRGALSGMALTALDRRLLSGQVDPTTMRNYYETQYTTDGHQGAGTSTGVFKHAYTAQADGWVDAVTADGLVYQHHLETGEVRQVPHTALELTEQIAKRPRHNGVEADQGDVEDLGQQQLQPEQDLHINFTDPNPLPDLRSCYAQPHPCAPGAPGEPAFTTFHSKSHSTVDYIWHDRTLTTEQVLEMQPKHVLERYHGLPSKTWSSDHMSLVADLSFAPYTDIASEATAASNGERAERASMQPSIEAVCMQLR